MKSTSLLFALFGGLALVGCGDDTSTTGAGGAGGAGSSGSTTATTGGPTTSSTASSSSSSGNPSSSSSGGDGGSGGSGNGGNGTGGEPGTGGNGTGGNPGTGGAGTGGDPGTGGAGGGAELAVCTDVALVASSDDECDLEGDLDLSTSGTAVCVDPFAGPPAPLVFYEISVEAGDCVGVRADNAGSLGADIWIMVVDPDGNNIVFDDVINCTVGNVSCPEGGFTMASAGSAYVGVGAYTDADDGCPEGERAPYQVSVNINGTDVSLAGADVCEGDLFEL